MDGKYVIGAIRSGTDSSKASTLGKSLTTALEHGASCPGNVLPSTIGYHAPNRRQLGSCFSPSHRTPPTQVNSGSCTHLLSPEAPSIRPSRQKQLGPDHPPASDRLSQ